jgi:hypothetical protein
MEQHKIAELIDKYFDGNTTLKEEQILKNYFQQNEVIPEWDSYRSYFGYLNHEKSEQFDKTIQLPQNKKRKASWSLVAALVLISGISLIYESQKTTPVDLGTFDDPELAIQETQKALQLVSMHLNKGMEQTKHLETFNQSKKLIFKEQ